ncbi:MAG TPA: hypothetical protein VGG67_10425 [Steroidobacteraceae bacterium]|jgi:hypothetical protein
MAGPSDSDVRKVTSLRELPQSIEPPHDLWPAIEAQLGGIPTEGSAADGAKPAYRRVVRMRWLAAAAMLACVATGVWIGRGLLPGTPGAGTSPSVTNRVPVPGIAPTALDAAYVSDPRYQQQRAALVRQLQARLAALPAPERDKVTASLEAIEKAKADLEQALGHDPSNALLQELLVNTYQDEMRVLTDVHEASDPGRGI